MIKTTYEMQAVSKKYWKIKTNIKKAKEQPEDANVLVY